MMKPTPLALAILLALVLALPVTAQQYYAATGNYTNFVFSGGTVSATKHVPTIINNGIVLDRLVLTDMPDSPSPNNIAPLLGYQATARYLRTVLNDSLTYTGQRKIILDLANTFFEFKDYGTNQSNWVPCLDYGSQPLVRFRWELRPNYQNRLSDFIAQAGFPQPVAADFEFISVHPETGCIPGSSIQMAAQAVKAALPGVKVAAGYPISLDATGGSNAVNYLPAKFPTALDRVLTWSYGTMDPANVNDPRNHSASFPNYYATLKGKLNTGQKIDWVVDGHFLVGRHGNTNADPNVGFGWNLGPDHAQLMYNFCRWAPTQPLINGQIVFTWAASPDPNFFSVAEMPTVVRQTMANVSRDLCSATTLYLHGNRFRATLSWRNPSTGATGVAKSLPYSPEGGFFYFTSPANVEVGVKVLDGRTINGKFWVFHGALTSLEYTLTVTDASTGAVKTYFKPASTGSNLCGGADTAAFLTTASDAPLKLGDGLLVPLEATAAKATCTSTTTSICVLNRFRLQVRKGGVLQNGIPLTDLTGVFRFGSAGNPEVAVKVLDGRTINGKFWVFFGSLTDQTYQVIVTDTATGAAKTYNSPAPHCGTADTGAF
jgi:hypothetical protein